MFDKRNMKNIAIRFPVLKAGLAAIGFAALAGCSGYESMAQKPIDRDFKLYHLNWTSGTSNAVVIAAFKDEGRVALCAAYTTDMGNFESQASRQYFNTSNIYIGEERIGPMSFMNSIEISSRKADPDKAVAALLSIKANCVRTSREWENRFATENVSWKGPRRITVFD